MLSRRALVGKAATGVAGAAVAWVGTGGRAKRALASTRPESLTASEPTSSTTANEAKQFPNTVVPGASEDGPPPWELIAPLAKRSEVANGWQVADLSGAIDGSYVLTLKNGRGRSHRIHICANDGAPQGLVHTRHFDLLVMNGGQGDLPTEEGFAQAVAAVGKVLARNDAGKATALLPHIERLRRFATVADARLR